MSPNPKRPPLPGPMVNLQEATAARALAVARHREAVFAAIDSGGSVREVAAVGMVSTRTVQDWLKQRST